jgi:hypothetical protein
MADFADATRRRRSARTGTMSTPRWIEVHRPPSTCLSNLLSVETAVVPCFAMPHLQNSSTAFRRLFCARGANLMQLVVREHQVRWAIVFIGAAANPLLEATHHEPCAPAFITLTVWPVPAGLEHR